MDVTEAYHCVMLRPSGVGDFAYITPPAADDDFIIICINLILLVVWVESPKYI